MLAELTAGYQATKATLDIAKGIKALNSEAEINAAVIDIQRLTIEAQHSLMEAQERHTALVGRVSELENEIMRLKDWTAEREKYQLRQIDRDCVAFMRKKGMEDGEPPHWLCTQCFGEGQKSYLQRVSEANGRATHRCNRCASTIYVYARTYPGEEDD